LRRALRGHAEHDVFVDLVSGKSRAARQRDLPPAAEVRHAGAGVALRYRPGHRAVGRRPRAARSWRRGRCVNDSQPIVAAEHLSKWYGQVIGLNDVTLGVPPGITGLLGPNG